MAVKHYPIKRKISYFYLQGIHVRWFILFTRTLGITKFGFSFSWTTVALTPNPIGVADRIEVSSINSHLNAFKKSLLRSIFALLIFPGCVLAGTITNGDFGTDLSGWSTVDGNGTVMQSGGQAILSTGSGADPFSAILVQGDDGSFSFSSPILITASDQFFTFDALFSDLGSDSGEGASVFTDQLNVWLYDANDPSGLSDILIAGLTTNSSFSFDLSGLAGRLVAFSFELDDEDDGRNTQVAIDNVRIEQFSVPEPASFIMVLIGLAGLGIRRRRI